MKRCVKCGCEHIENGICMGCGADLNRMQEETSSLIDGVIFSRPFASLLSSCTACFAALLVACVLALFSGQIRLTLPLVLSCFAVVLIARPLKNIDAPKNSTAPYNMFIVSVLIEAVSNALIVAVCVGVCIGGKDTIDNVFAMYGSLTGVDFISALTSQATELNMSISENMIYLSVYIACIVSMFISVGAVLLGGVEFMFLTSLRSSVKSNKIELTLLNLFSVTLLIKAIFNLAAILFSVSFADIAVFAASGYFYLCAHRCMKEVVALYK